MNQAAKILWSEGLAMGPQQFQQQDLYHESRLHKIAFALNPHLWGVRSLRWNEDALANNHLAATALSLVFPDGEMVDAPGSDHLPRSVDLSTLPLGEQSFTFYAALPMLKAHGENLTDDARYMRADAETIDLFSDAANIDVTFLKKSVFLLSQLQPHDGFVSIPVARIRRHVKGGFEFDPAFIAPCTAIGAASALLLILDNLIGKLAVKVESLYLRHRQSHASTFEVQSGDIASFWMLNTISTANASLIHYSRLATHHPELLFDKLTSLAGGLMTFSAKYSLSDLPAYRHEDLASSFHTLDVIIRDLTDTVISSKSFTIPLKVDPQRSSHYFGKLDPTAISAQTELCLAVNADMPALELAGSVPLLFKIGSPDNVEMMVASSLPGIGLVHMAQVPPAIPVRPNTYYFSLQAKGGLYENMLKSQTVAIYVPKGMNALRMELFGIDA
ncbi:MAG: type VI secretion system baseplate subunit TssK [Telluria sp.]